MIFVRKRCLAVACALLLASGVAGCLTTAIHDPDAHVRGFAHWPENAEFVKAVAKENRDKVTRWYREEWAYNRFDKTSPPRRCLALSGGGIRSASFSIGVMRAFQELKLLGHMDAISAVSGGSYAVGWYYAQHYNPEGKKFVAPADIFDPASKAQKRLEENSGFFPVTRYAVSGVGNTLLIPYNLFANFLFGWHQNTSPGRGYYQIRIKETFMEGKEINLRNLGPAIKGHLPFPIINTTASIDDEPHHFGQWLRNSVFEFTPLWYGSDGFGYRLLDADDSTNLLDQEYTYADLDRVISISGAALDSNIFPGQGLTVAASVLNQDLGFYINNYNEGARDNWWRHTMLPFPFYFASGHYGRDTNGIEIYLSDGGHSENLGAYALIRRLCRDIVVVDAEQDGNYVFDAYFKLRKAVASEQGASLEIPDIEEPKTPFARGRIKNTRVFVPIKHLEEPKGSNPTTFDTSRPVREGAIRSLPLYNPKGGEPEKLDIKVYYVKLSIDKGQAKIDLSKINKMCPRGGEERRQCVRKMEASGVIFYTGDTLDYYENDSSQCDPTTQNCFPHESTIDQSYDTAQFRAYRDLGYVIAKNCIAYDSPDSPSGGKIRVVDKCHSY